ncbi:ANK_REP_REGION domain-containing protein [Durusdinium trenchii]|uniref:ANK_REP_REGION domain-containing protein n=1 Tax=Durusdinium trenchii TaxID=1381693 RepID=A0ABP0QSM4_9DINO
MSWLCCDVHVGEEAMFAQLEEKSKSSTEESTWADSSSEAEAGEFKQVDEEFLRCMKSCRLLEAVGHCDDPELRKDLKVLSQRFDASMQIINTKHCAMTVSGEHPDLNFVYGMNMESQSFKIAVDITWHLDSMRELLIFASLYIAKDAQVGFDTTMRSAEALGVHTATEAFWRVRGVDGVGMKTDDILQRNWLIPKDDSAYDAWLVETSAAEKFNLPVDEGHYRAPDVLNYFVLAGRAEKEGYALNVKTIITISPDVVTMALLRLMPAWALRKALGSTIRQAVKGTPAHVERHRSKLVEAVDTSPAAGFFQALEQRIREKSSK